MNANSMKKPPKYKGFRIFIVALILYYMLVSPVLGILFISNSPKIVTNQVFDTIAEGVKDTILLAHNEPEILIDSIEVSDSVHSGRAFVLDSKKPKKKVHFDMGKDITGSEILFMYCLLASFVLGFAFSLPYKIFFRRKRKGSHIPARIEWFVRKTILHSPLILALIISLPFILQNLNLIDKHFISEVFKESFQRKMSLQYWAIFLLAGMLTIAFVYLWQKNKVQIVYLHHVFSADELKRRIFSKGSGRIISRLVLTSFLTTLLPLTIVVAYLLMSLTALSDIGLYEPSQGELKVIFGQYYEMIKNNDVQRLLRDVDFSYINVIDTFLLFLGIGVGIVVTIIYLLFFVHWTNRGITYPIKELLYNMQKTTGGQLENYSLVRTNDEIGDLSENYNIMTAKLKEYISHIDQMNAELEQKVKERTAEIQSQKEEIESQRDEVESQRDEIERQRDYVIEQRDLIISQKKAITDSIEYAASIQSAILPPARELDRILPEYFVFYRPRDIVSGDFYWAYKIKKKNADKVILVAADSTGHGVPGAIMSMLGITLLREIVLRKEIHSPSVILDKLKANVVNSLHQTDEIGKSKDGIDLSVCMIDFTNKKLKYAGAYNPIYIVRDTKAEIGTGNEASHQILDKIRKENDGSKILYEIRADRNPIGLSHQNLMNYSLQSFDLEPNDIIYMFSDGYADQFGGKNRHKYMYSRFKKLLAGISSETMEMQNKALERNLKDWMGSEKQIDDILVMGIRIK
jgi:serine phosphatase RsbU (regulator of sigma subunit)